jgi:hypothetical protein
MNSTATSSQQENRISMSGKTNKLDLSSQMPNLTLTSPKSSSGTMLPRSSAKVPVPVSTLGPRTQTTAASLSQFGAFDLQTLSSPSRTPSQPVHSKSLRSREAKTNNAVTYSGWDSYVGDSVGLSVEEITEMKRHQANDHNNHGGNTITSSIFGGQSRKHESNNWQSLDFEDLSTLQQSLRSAPITSEKPPLQKPIDSRSRSNSVRRRQTITDKDLSIDLSEPRQRSRSKSPSMDSKRGRSRDSSPEDLIRRATRSESVISDPSMEQWTFDNLAINRTSSTEQNQAELDISNFLNFSAEREDAHANRRASLLGDSMDEEIQRMQEETMFDESKTSTALDNIIPEAAISLFAKKGNMHKMSGSRTMFGGQSWKQKHFVLLANQFQLTYGESGKDPSSWEGCIHLSKNCTVRVVHASEPAFTNRFKQGPKSQERTKSIPSRSPSMNINRLVSSTIALSPTRDSNSVDGTVGYNNCLELKVPDEIHKNNAGRTYYFRCAFLYEANEWAFAIQQVIDYIRNNHHRKSLRLLVDDGEDNRFDQQSDDDIDDDTEIDVDINMASIDREIPELLAMEDFGDTPATMTVNKVEIEADLPSSRSFKKSKSNRYSLLSKDTDDDKSSQSSLGKMETDSQDSRAVDDEPAHATQEHDIIVSSDSHLESVTTVVAEPATPEKPRASRLAITHADEVDKTDNSSDAGSLAITSTDDNDSVISNAVGNNAVEAALTEESMVKVATPAGLLDPANAGTDEPMQDVMIITLPQRHDGEHVEDGNVTGHRNPLLLHVGSHQHLTSPSALVEIEGMESVDDLMLMQQRMSPNRMRVSSSTSSPKSKSNPFIPASPSEVACEAMELDTKIAPSERSLPVSSVSGIEASHAVSVPSPAQPSSPKSRHAFQHGQEQSQPRDYAISVTPAVTATVSHVDALRSIPSTPSSVSSASPLTVDYSDDEGTGRGPVSHPSPGRHQQLQRADSVDSIAFAELMATAQERIQQLEREHNGSRRQHLPTHERQAVDLSFRDEASSQIHGNRKLLQQMNDHISRTMATDTVMQQSNSKLISTANLRVDKKTPIVFAPRSPGTFNKTAPLIATTPARPASSPSLPRQSPHGGNPAPLIQTQPVVPVRDHVSLTYARQQPTLAQLAALTENDMDLFTSDEDWSSTGSNAPIYGRFRPNGGISNLLGSPNMAFGNGHTDECSSSNPVQPASVVTTTDRLSVSTPSSSSSTRRASPPKKVIVFDKKKSKRQGSTNSGSRDHMNSNLDNGYTSDGDNNHLFPGPMLSRSHSSQASPNPSPTRSTSGNASPLQGHYIRRSPNRQHFCAQSISAAAAAEERNLLMKALSTSQVSELLHALSLNPAAYRYDKERMIEGATRSPQVRLQTLIDRKLKSSLAVGANGSPSRNDNFDDSSACARDSERLKAIERVIVTDNARRTPPRQRSPHGNSSSNSSPDASSSLCAHSPRTSSPRSAQLSPRQQELPLATTANISRVQEQIMKEVSTTEIVQLLQTLGLDPGKYDYDKLKMIRAAHRVGPNQLRECLLRNIRQKGSVSPSRISQQPSVPGSSGSSNPTVRLTSPTNTKVSISTSPKNASKNAFDEKYQLGRVLESGSCSVTAECNIRGATVEQNKHLHLIARITNKRNATAEVLHQARQEIACMKEIAKSSVSDVICTVRYIDSYESGDFVYLCMQRTQTAAMAVPLVQFLQDRKLFDEFDARQLIQSLVHAMKYLQESRIDCSSLTLDSLMVFRHSTLSTNDLILRDFRHTQLLLGGSNTYVDQISNIQRLGVISYFILGGQWITLPQLSATLLPSSGQFLSAVLNFSSPEWYNVSLDAKLLLRTMLMTGSQSGISIDDLIFHDWVRICSIIACLWTHWVINFDVIY